MAATEVNELAGAAYMSLADFARRHGVSRAAVSQAVQSGRLRDSVRTVDDRPVIVDVALADREWGPGRRAPSKTKHAIEAREEGVPAIAVSRARFEAARAALAAIELAEKKGRLVIRDEARAAVAEKFTAVRTRLLGLPTRIKQRVPNVTADDVRVIDSLVREALEELANGGSE